MYTSKVEQVNLQINKFVSDAAFTPSGNTAISKLAAEQEESAPNVVTVTNDEAPVKNIPLL